LEELGWTGFAVPTLLRQRYGALATGLLVGVPWGVEFGALLVAE